MKKNEKIEEKVAQTILELPDVTTIGGKEYRIAPPSIGTLILCSAEIAKMPQLVLDPDRVAQEVLAKAKDCVHIGMVIATAILGARDYQTYEWQKFAQEKRIFFGLIKYTKQVKKRVLVDKRVALAQTILNELTPSEVQVLLSQLLGRMELGDFFAITTFLNEINMTKPTRGVETEATASGQ